MTEPTIAPMNVTVPVVETLPAAPVEVTQTPPPAVEKTAVETALPVVETPSETPTHHTRGRQPSQRTLAIRKMLDESNGEMTHSTALPLLLLAGYEEIDANGFNVIKSNWKKAKEENEKPVKIPAAVVKSDNLLLDAVKFVEDSGGLSKAEARLAHYQALVDTFKSLLKLAA